MGQSGNLNKVVLASSLALVLSACGTDTPSGGASQTTTATTTTGGTTTVTAGSTAAATAVISRPEAALNDPEDGYYRLKVTVKVEAGNGDYVPDGTPVHLSVIDSIIATGTIDVGDDITASVLTDMGPVDAAGAGVQFDSAKIIRNSAYRFIEEGDMVLAGLRPTYDPSDTGLGLAPEEDKIRFISDAVINNNEVTVSTAYTNTYPSAPYVAGEMDYLIGASLLGSTIVGEVDDGTTVSESSGISYTSSGKASFWFSYPARPETLGLGCDDLDTDSRVSPVGSAKVYLAARVSDTVTVIDDSYCFASLDGGSMEVEPKELDGAGTVNITLFDGSGVRLALWPITSSVTTTGTVSVSVLASDYTNEDGYLRSPITVSGGASGDTAEVTYSNGVGEIAVVNITIP